MATGLYEPTGSFLHRLDPSAKLLCLVGWLVAALATTSSAGLLVLASVVLAAVAVSGVRRVFARFGAYMTILFFMCALLWSLFAPSREGILSPENLALGARLALRLVILLALGLLFLASTRPEEITAGLRRLGL